LRYYKAEQVQQLDEMGVEFVGFNFYPKSPRYVFKSMSAPAVKKLRGNIYKVGIFVNAPIDEVLRLVDECGLYLVQLHGDESPRTCEKISNYISVIKAFRISEHENIEWKIREYYDAADMFLFDTNFTNTKETNYGGTGIKFNWELLKGKNIHKPFFSWRRYRLYRCGGYKTIQQRPRGKALICHRHQQQI